MGWSNPSPCVILLSQFTDESICTGSVYIYFFLYSNGSVEIQIDIVENGRDCTIKIRDNGMGIPPQYIKNIFEKFFRVPQGDAQSIKGFGLGLYYVGSIIKKHSGNITVHSKLQSGTEFIITLPKTHDTDLID